MLLVVLKMIQLVVSSLLVEVSLKNKKSIVKLALFSTIRACLPFLGNGTELHQSFNLCDILYLS